jgi:spermidine synthase
VANADPAAGPVAGIGAGAGLVTEAIADLLPDARIIAVEPDPAMRTSRLTIFSC